MTRAELKRNAREKLGGQLFGPNWVNAVLVMAIFYILTGAVNGIAGFGTLIMLVIGGPLSYGVAKLFLQQCDDGQKMNPTEVFKGFSEDFGGSFILYLLRYLFIALWSILLIIPGIVKMYSYSMAFFIKADHPSYDWRECLDASSQLTYGHKMGTVYSGSEFYWLADRRKLMPGYWNFLGKRLQRGYHCGILQIL